MHHGIRGALAADDALRDLGADCKFRIRETQEWNTLLLSKLKWLGVECFSTSSIGRKIRRRCSLRMMLRGSRTPFPKAPIDNAGEPCGGRHCPFLINMTNRNGSVRFGHNNHVARKWRLGPVQGMGDLCGGGVKIIRQQDDAMM